MPETSVLHLDDFDTWLQYYHRVGEPGPYHHPRYLEMLAGGFEHEQEQPELFVLEDGDDLIYYPYIRRPLTTVSFADSLDERLRDYDDIVSSWYFGGPIASENIATSTTGEFSDEFSRYCSQTGIVAEFIRFDPNIENHETFSVLEPEFNRETVPVDLRKSKDEIWEGYESRNQRAIRQAEESDIEIDREYSEADITAFHSIYQNAMDARDAAEHYRFSLEFFREILASDLFELVVARHGDQVIGGFIIALDDTISHHYLSASNPEYWDDRVNNLMYHEVVLYMKDTGRDLFDFQGGRPGVFNFKKGFSPDRGEFYIGKRIHIEDVYDELVEIASGEGIDTDTGYFPTYRVEQSN